MHAGFQNLESEITVEPDETATVRCQILCNGFDWSGCGVRPNAIVIVPAKNYSTHEVCDTGASRHNHFNNPRQGYNVTATCDLNGIQPETLCSDVNGVLNYSVTLRGFASSNLTEFVVVCGLARNISLNQSEPLVAVNGLNHRLGIIRVRKELTPGIKAISS